MLEDGENISNIVYRNICMNIWVTYSRKNGLLKKHSFANLRNVYILIYYVLIVGLCYITRVLTEIKSFKQMVLSKEPLYIIQICCT